MSSEENLKWNIKCQNVQEGNKEPGPEEKAQKQKQLQGQDRIYFIVSVQ